MSEKNEAYEIDGKRLSQKKRPELLALCRRLHEELRLELARNTAAHEEIETLSRHVAGRDASISTLQSNTDYMKADRDKALEVAKELRDALRRPLTIEAPIVNPTPVTAYARLGLLPWLLSAAGYVAGALAVAQAAYWWSRGWLVLPW